MTIARLSFKLLMRDWRAGELRILMLALIIAVTAMSSISFYTNRVARALTEQAASMLGADLIVTSPAAIPANWQILTKKLQLKSSIIINYPTVITAGDQLQLVNLKAVQSNYPLRGNLQTSMQLNGQSQMTQGIPAIGTAWVEPRLMELLHLKTGDTITIGVAPFTIARILTALPETKIFNIAPSVLINQADVNKTQTLLPGSRVEYQLLIAGNAADVNAFKNSLQNKLTPSQKITDINSDQPALFYTLKRADNYLTLASMVCIILAGIAITSAAYRYSERHYNHTALLRCLGLTRTRLIKLVFYQLIIIGATGSALGCLFGFLGQALFANIAAAWFKLTLPAPDIYPIVTGFLTGFLLLIGFALPRYLRLVNVAPLQVLRKDLLASPSGTVLIYAFALGATAALLFWHTHNSVLTAILLYGLGFAAAALYLCARLLISISSLFKNRTTVSWHYGLANLARRAQSSTIQLIAFGLIIMVALLLFMLRYDLLNTWRAQIPTNAPNYFVINIQPDEVKNIDGFFALNNIQHSAIYPVVRGRLIQLNNVPIKQAVPINARNDNALNRELNLTWSQQLPATNYIIAGHWWQSANKPVVSVEQGLANKFGIKLGDKLSFLIADQTLSAEVVNIRSVEWSSLQPNFFMIFPPQQLDAFPTTYLASFYLPPAKRIALATLAKQFPSVTIIDTAEMLAQIQLMIDRISLAISYLMLFTLLASFAVLFAAIQASLPERRYEAALLRTLGASRYQIKSGIMAEFVCLGLLAGLLGTLAANGITWLLANKVFLLAFHLNYFLSTMGILAGGIIIMVAGILGTRDVTNQSPLSILRR